MKTQIKLLAAAVSSSLLIGGVAIADDKNYGDRNFDARYSEYSDRYDSRDRERRDTRYNDRYQSSQPIVMIKRAKVLGSDPIYRQVSNAPRSREQCWTEPRHVNRSDRRAGSLVGAVLGGVIGYKVGGNHRHNKRTGAAVGAVLGSAIGKEAASNKHRSSRHCETVYSNSGYQRQELVGYNVTYKYHGQRYTTFMDYDPGRYVQLEITARPLAR